jgi:hypothetical protein
VQLVGQAVCQQIVLQDMAAKHQDIAATLAFELGDLRVRIGAADDARIMPWIELVLCD